MRCLPTWGRHGVAVFDADVRVVTSSDKRRGGSSATTPRNPQQPKPTKKGGPVVKRP